MFKRVEKRRRKQEDEEALGLTEEMKEVLGQHDTDTDESLSSEDDNSDDEAENEEDGDGAGEEDENEDEEDSQDSEKEEEEEEDSIDDSSEPSIPVSVALDDPLYIVSLDPEIQACILCPGKILKNATMIEVHKKSQAHARRYTRFVNVASKAPPEDEARKYVQFGEQDAAPTTEKGPSKRAAKRKAKLDKIKNKRQQQKARKAKAALKKKSSTNDDGDATAKDTRTSDDTKHPQVKRRKIDKDGDTAALKPAEPILTKAKKLIADPVPSKTMPKAIQHSEVKQKTDTQQKKKRPSEAGTIRKTKKLGPAVKA